MLHYDTYFCEHFTIANNIVRTKSRTNSLLPVQVVYTCLYEWRQNEQRSLRKKNFALGLVIWTEIQRTCQYGWAQAVRSWRRHVDSLLARSSRMMRVADHRGSCPPPRGWWDHWEIRDRSEHLSIGSGPLRELTLYVKQKQ